MAKNIDNMPDLGLKLSEAVADKGKVAINVAWRLPLCFLCEFAALGGRSSIVKVLTDPFYMKESFILTIIILTIASLAVGLFPLLHLVEKLSFYEKGMIYKGITLKEKSFVWSEVGTPAWKGSGNGLFYRTYLDVGKKRLNITYLKSPKKAYNQAYMDY